MPKAFDIKNVLTKLLLALTALLMIGSSARAEQALFQVGDEVYINSEKKTAVICEINEGQARVKFSNATQSEFFKNYSLSDIYKKSNCVGEKNSFCYYRNGQQVLIVNAQNQVFRLQSSSTAMSNQPTDNRDPVETMFDAQSDQAMMESRSVLDTW